MSNVQKSRGRPVDSDSGLYKARQVFASLPEDGRGRKDAISAFTKIETKPGKLMSKGTAAAYYTVINRAS